MTRVKFSQLLVSLVLLGTMTSAHAQGTGDNSATQSGGGASGAPVQTGSGPLAQPIPPAASSANPRQNLQQDPQRPQGTWGPARTNPPQQPFGSSR